MTSADSLLGEIAVEMGIITPQQWEQALEEQKQSFTALEKILFQKQFLTVHQIKLLRQEMAKRQSTPKNLALSGIAEGLDLKLPEETQDELCGHTVGDYQILSRLGSGAMGVVYKAEQSKLKRLVALKMLSIELSKESFYRERFIIEARSAAQLNHPHILQIYDADCFEDRYFFSMEFVKGESIGPILERQQKLPINVALEITVQITRALTEMYEHQIVHRDIKPENIMLATKGIAKLADLGLAKNVSYSSEEPNFVMGTPYYIAPEQISNPKDVDARADIYSLGAAFFHMVTGVVPFMHHDPRVVLMRVIKENLPSPSNINSSVPHTVSWVIEKMMEKNRENRFSNPADLLTTLLGIQAQSSKTTQGFQKPTLHQQEEIKIEASSVDISNLEFAEPAPPPPPPPPPPAIIDHHVEMVPKNVAPKASIADLSKTAVRDVPRPSTSINKCRQTRALVQMERPSEKDNSKLILLLAIVLGVVFLGILGKVILGGKPKKKPKVAKKKNLQRKRDRLERERKKRIERNYKNLCQDVKFTERQSRYPEKWKESIEKTLKNIETFSKKYPEHSQKEEIENFKILLVKNLALAEKRIQHDSKFASFIKDIDENIRNQKYREALIQMKSFLEAEKKLEKNSMMNSQNWKTFESKKRDIFKKIKFLIRKRKQMLRRYLQKRKNPGCRQLRKI